MVVAAVRGLGTLVGRVGRAPAAAAMRRPGRARAVALGLAGTALLASVLCNLLYGPLLRQNWIAVPGLPEPNAPSAYDVTRRAFRDRMVRRIPAQGGVVAAFEFLARLASRRDVHSLHHIYTGYYTYSTERYPVPDGIAALVADIGDQRLATYVKPGTPLRLRDLVARNDLRPVDSAGDLVLFLRAPSDTVELFRVDAPSPATAREVSFDGQLAFAGFTMPESTAVAGGLLPIETCWRRVADPDRQYMIQLMLRDAEGRTVFSVIRHLGYLLYPVAEWPAGATVRETYRMVIPPNIPPGVYALGMRVAWWREGPLALSQPDDPRISESGLVVPLARFTVTSPRTR